MKLLEICANSYESAVNACRGGADRVELCSILEIGGVSPSSGAISSVLTLPIDVNVLIRPRGGDFCYNDYEIDEILHDIEMCASLGVKGVVIGALNPDGTIDTSLCNSMVELARKHGLLITFHRAIDRTIDIYTALEDVITLGVDRVLTSGGAISAYEGRETLRKMVELTAGRVKIMAGAGINPSNVLELIQYTNVDEIHMSATIKTPSIFPFVDQIDGDTTLLKTSAEIVASVKQLLS